MLGSLLGTATRIINVPASVVDSAFDDKSSDELRREDRFASAPLEELARAFDDTDRKERR